MGHLRGLCVKGFWSHITSQRVAFRQLLCMFAWWNVLTGLCRWPDGQKGRWVCVSSCGCQSWLWSGPGRELPFGSHRLQRQQPTCCQDQQQFSGATLSCMTPQQRSRAAQLHWLSPAAPRRPLDFGTWQSLGVSFICRSYGMALEQPTSALWAMQFAWLVKGVFVPAVAIWWCIRLGRAQPSPFAMLLSGVLVIVLTQLQV